MPWIKKNLMLVLGGLIGLVLLGGSGFFLFSESSREGGINTALEEKRGEWNRLNALNPFPDEKNIKAVKDDTARLEKLSASLKESIRPVDLPPVSDTYSLKLLLETSISQLKDEAEAAGVNLPDRYAFTFQRLREMPQFDSNSIPKLAEQVGQISMLCRVLYAARVHSLDTLRRSPVLREEGGSSDYLTKKSVTNSWVVRTPYDFSFRAFSGELAGVLRGLAALPQVVAIKTINIEPTTLTRSGGAGNQMMPVMPSGPTMMPGSGGFGGGGGMDPALAQRYGIMPGGRAAAEGGGGGGMDPALAQRYGMRPGGGGSGEAAMRSRYGIGGPAMAPPPALSSPMSSGMPMAPAAPSGPTVALDEKPLRVILQVDFVKPKPEADASRRTAKSPSATNPAAGAGSESQTGEAAQPEPSN